MKTVLVTGGAGFIGSHLCERLTSAGNSVICLDNFCDSYAPSIKRENMSQAIQSPMYRSITGDILDTPMLTGIFTNHRIDTVVHLAALAGVRKSIENPLDYIDVDIKGTVNLLEVCRKYKVRKFVFASSSSVYGNGALPFREDVPAVTQVSPYAAAKLSGELFCRTYNQLYGIPVVCLRFFTVYGPRQRPDMAIRIFTEAICEGREIGIFGDGKSSRDYTYIDDIVDGIVSSAELDCGFEIFNLGSSAPVSLIELIGMIEKKVSKKADIKYLPAQAGDVSDTLADIGKAAKLLAYHPKVRLEQGIENFVSWYLKTAKGRESKQ